MTHDDAGQLVHVAVDDTDSREEGMCTTYLAHRLLEALPNATPVGAPHLVRLNPSVPWRTRGNGAVALSLRTDLTLDEVLAEAAEVVEEMAVLDDPDTQPGLAVSRERPPGEVYQRTVQELVDPGWAREVLDDVGARTRGWSGGRGLVGCAAALAWDPADPARRSTWELLAYRTPARWGTPRDVDAGSLRRIDARHPSLFDTWDPDAGAPACVPGGPDPVLWGLRGTDRDAPLAAAEDVVGEAPASTRLFRTNQGSDDHLRHRTVEALEPHTAARVEVEVAGEPWRIRGGHVFLPAEDASGSVTLAAFEPTGSFRHVVTALEPGDRVVACGGVKAGPGGDLTLHLEKLRVLSAPPRRVKVGNPRCEGCERAMGSRGRDAGYRCPSCGAEVGEDAVPTRRVPRGVEEGWYEVPPGARRHLARPVALMGERLRDRAKAYEPERSIPQR